MLVTSKNATKRTGGIFGLVTRFVLTSVYSRNNKTRFDSIGYTVSADGSRRTPEAIFFNSIYAIHQHKGAKEWKQ
jgi:hypothetical protein